MDTAVMSWLDIGEQRLRVATWGGGVPEVVMLHDGLGSIPQWRDVPAQVAARSGLTVMAYERAGHGESMPVPAGPWPADWLHREAGVLGEVLDAIGAVDPILVGHSDGGSTALIHASEAHNRVRAVLALAPHSWVEDVCYRSIQEMRRNASSIVNALARSHRHPAEVFEAWSGVWVSDEFRSWDIRPILGSIGVRTLVAQGADDAYASDDQAHLTAAAVGGNGQSLIVPGVGHIMHHDDPEIVISLICDFLNP